MNNKVHFWSFRVTWQYYLAFSGIFFLRCFKSVSENCPVNFIFFIFYFFHQSPFQPDIRYDSPSNSRSYYLTHTKFTLKFTRSRTHVWRIKLFQLCKLAPVVFFIVWIHLYTQNSCKTQNKWGIYILLLLCVYLVYVYINTWGFFGSIHNTKGRNVFLLCSLSSFVLLV